MAATLGYNPTLGSHFQGQTIRHDKIEDTQTILLFESFNFHLDTWTQFFFCICHHLDKNPSVFFYDMLSPFVITGKYIVFSFLNADGKIVLFSFMPGLVCNHVLLSLGRLPGLVL